MKKRSGDPWMPAAEYARGLRGLTANLLVRDIDAALRFQTEVLGAVVVYSDPDFAVCRHGEAEWMLHADHTYDTHPLHDLVREARIRGAGCELRLHGRDPDEAEAAARRRGHRVLAPAQDKAHGTREVFIVDGDGYVWVPDIALTGR